MRWGEGRGCVSAWVGGCGWRRMETQGQAGRLAAHVPPAGRRTAAVHSSAAAAALEPSAAAAANAPVHQGAVHQALLHDGHQVLAHVLDDRALLSAVHARHEGAQVRRRACGGASGWGTRRASWVCFQARARHSTQRRPLATGAMPALARKQQAEHARPRHPATSRVHAQQASAPSPALSRPPSKSTYSFP